LVQALAKPPNFWAVMIRPSPRSRPLKSGGRNDSISDEVIGALPEIEATAELGWFIGSGFTLANVGLDSDGIVIGRLSVVTDVGDGHGGTVVNGSVGLVTPVTENFRVIPSISFNYGDENYTQSFYGVSADNATADLPAFNASAGLESQQFAVVAIHKFNPKWSLTGIAAATTAKGDAARSPIVQRGRKSQVFTGFTVNYNF